MAHEYQHMQQHYQVLAHVDEHFPLRDFDPDNYYRPQYGHHAAEKSHRDSVSSFGSSQSTSSASSLFDSATRTSRQSRASSNAFSVSSTEAPPTHSSLDSLDRCLTRDWQPSAYVPFEGQDILPYFIPCEFRWYGSCSWQCPADDVESYVQHVASRHLNHNLPYECLCWWCDDFSFRVEHRSSDTSTKNSLVSRGGGDCEKWSPNHRQHERFSQTVQMFPDTFSCFRARVDHIATHVSHGEHHPSHGVRPDHPMLHHLARQGLIERRKLGEMKTISELPLGSGPDLHAEDWRPEPCPRSLMERHDLGGEKRALRREERRSGKGKRK